jgi:hypothetical protein
VREALRDRGRIERNSVASWFAILTKKPPCASTGWPRFREERIPKGTRRLCSSKRGDTSYSVENEFRRSHAKFQDAVRNDFFRGFFRRENPKIDRFLGLQIGISVAARAFRHTVPCARMLLSFDSGKEISRVARRQSSRSARTTSRACHQKMQYLVRFSLRRNLALLHLPREQFTHDAE